MARNGYKNKGGKLTDDIEYRINQAEKRLIDEVRKIGWGELEHIIIQNYRPILIKKSQTTIKLDITE
jgi:hypothetical protein